MGPDERGIRGPDDGGVPLGNVELGAIAFANECSGCHQAKDGFDLAFFAFTDTTIVRRAVAHVDTSTAFDIVAHVRSLDVRPSFEEERPFQPEGVVLGGDRSFAFGLFGTDAWPLDLTTEDLRAIDPRGIPVAISFPRWSIEENNRDWMPDRPLPSSVLEFDDGRVQRRLDAFHRLPSVENLVDVVDALRDSERALSSEEAPCVTQPRERFDPDTCFEIRRWTSALGAQFMFKRGLELPLHRQIHDAWWDTGQAARRSVVFRDVQGEVENGLENWVSWMWMGWSFEPARHASVYLAQGLDRKGLHRHATFHVLRAAVARGRGSSAPYRDVRNVASFAPEHWLFPAMRFGFRHLLERLEGGERPRADMLEDAIADVERAYTNSERRLGDDHVAEIGELRALRDYILSKLR